MTTKEEIFAQYDIDDLSDILQSDYEWKSNSDWKFIASEMSGYDEGTVYTDNVWQHVPTGRYFKYQAESNSWDDYSEGFKLEEVEEVKPAEVTVTQYVPV